MWGTVSNFARTDGNDSSAETGADHMRVMDTEPVQVPLFAFGPVSSERLIRLDARAMPLRQTNRPVPKATPRGQKRAADAPTDDQLSNDGGAKIPVSVLRRALARRLTGKKHGQPTQCDVFEFHTQPA